MSANSSHHSTGSKGPPFIKASGWLILPIWTGLRSLVSLGEDYGVEKIRERWGRERLKENVLRILGSQSEIHHWDPHTAHGVMIWADPGSRSIPQLYPFGWFSRDTCSRDMGRPSLFPSQGSCEGNSLVLAPAHTSPLSLQGVFSLLELLSLKMRQGSLFLPRDHTSAFSMFILFKVFINFSQLSF